MLLTETARAVGLDQALSAALAVAVAERGADPAKALLDLAVTLAMGGDCLADIAVLRAEPDLFGRHCCVGRGRARAGWADVSSSRCRGSSAVQLGRIPIPPEVIMLAVRWYLRYGLSYRDVEELLAERGITVDHVTIYRRARFTPS